MLTAADIAAKNRKSVMGVIAGIIAVCILGLCIKGAANLAARDRVGNANLSASRSSGGANLAASQSNKTPDLTVLGGLKAPNLQEPATRVQMPADVYAWLQHLQECDQYKSEITKQADLDISASMGAFASVGGITSPAEVDKLTDPDTSLKRPPGADSIDKTIDKITQQWTALKAKFDSEPPPAECQTIADAYDAGLADSIQTFQTIKGMVDGINVTDPNLSNNIQSTKSGLENIKSDHKAGVDDMFDKTDMLVQEICDKYNVTKWFKIDSHGGSSNLLSGVGGGLGL